MVDVSRINRYICKLYNHKSDINAKSTQKNHT